VDGNDTNPVKVRYAYTSQPLGNLLYNSDGMPVGPFSTCADGDAIKE